MLFSRPICQKGKRKSTTRTVTAHAKGEEEAESNKYDRKERRKEAPSLQTGFVMDSPVLLLLPFLEKEGRKGGGRGGRIGLR